MMQKFEQWRSLEERCCYPPQAVPDDARGLTERICELAERALNFRDVDENGNLTPINYLFVEFQELTEDARWDARQDTQSKPPTGPQLECMRRLVDFRRLLGSYIFNKHFRDGEPVATGKDIEAAIRCARADALRVWPSDH